MFKAFTASLTALLLLAGCNNSPAPATEAPKGPLLLAIELDSAGKIKTQATIDELLKIAKQITTNADKIMLHSHVEKSGNGEDDLQRSQAQAQAAKDAMTSTGLPRMYYNVGVDAHGSTKPIKGIPDTSPQNRRIEIEFL